jgi:hypothetical protein
MRFEIKSGGVIAILFGVAALSGGVFMLGLLAGYDVGRESQSSAAQVATDYSVSTPPASAAPAVESAPTPANATAAASAPLAPVPPPAAAAPDNSATPVAPIATVKTARVKHAQPAARPTASAPERMATETTPPLAGSMNEPPPDAGAGDQDDATTASDNESDSGPASAPAHRVAPVVASARPQSRHKPYTIQIQAAMDLSGANQMVHRLHALGFQPRMVPTELNGQTWYKVEIGPYATQEEAAAAQQQMHSKYNTTFGGGGTP